MKYHIEIKETAKEGVLQAVMYYEGQQENLGVRFLDQLEYCLDALRREPLIYQKKYKSFRQTIVKPFSYHIIYEVEENMIIVYKVVYSDRHPRNDTQKNNSPFSH